MSGGAELCRCRAGNVMYIHGSKHWLSGGVAQPPRSWGSPRLHQKRCNVFRVMSTILQLA